MNETTLDLIRQRARDRCEYCHLPQMGHEERFSTDHVIARKHGGTDSAENLALCCLRCNLYKGTDLSGIDPVTTRIVELFNPRRQLWREHFTWQGPMVLGITPTGRATAALLHMNDPERLRLRESLLAEGMLLPD